MDVEHILNCSPRMRQRMEKLREIKKGLDCFGSSRLSKVTVEKYVVNPIIDKLVDLSSSFGRGKYTLDFYDLYDNVPFKSHIFSLKTWGHRSRVNHSLNEDDDVETFNQQETEMDQEIETERPVFPERSIKLVRIKYFENQFFLVIIIFISLG